MYRRMCSVYRRLCGPVSCLISVPPRRLWLSGLYSVYRSLFGLYSVYRRLGLSGLCSVYRRLWTVWSVFSVPPSVCLYSVSRRLCLSARRAAVACRRRRWLIAGPARRSAAAPDSDKATLPARRCPRLPTGVTL